MQTISKTKSVIIRRLMVLLLVGLSLSNLFYSCKNTNEELVILYDKDFNEVKKLAKKENKVFCIVLSRPNCPPCQHYVQSLEALYSNVIFNVVDIYLPENQWYMQWLCVGASPTIAIFAPKGKLKAVVSGIAANAIQCIESSISGDAKCAEYFYYKHFPVEDDAMPMLNALLSCKQNLDKGKDIGKAIDDCLSQSAHPYSVYLKSLNEAKQGRDKEAVYWGNQFLSMINKNPFYFQVYSYLLKEVRTIADPNYNPADNGVLSVVNELPLGDCKLHESRPFIVTIVNTGNSPLRIKDIALGCTCVKLKNPEEKQYTLQPGQSQDIDFVFKTDTQGDIFREITFFSDGINPLETIRLTATVK